MKKEVEHNQAFIDGQNLYLGTTRSPRPWKIDSFKLRTYLRDKYNVEHAYYFFGCIQEDNQDLYSRLQEAGFIVVFREHRSDTLSHKKGMSILTSSFLL